MCAVEGSKTALWGAYNAVEGAAGVTSHAHDGVVGRRFAPCGPHAAK